MTTEVETEAVLSPEDLRSILKVCSTEGVLVGGQALAFWANHFAVRRPPDLEPAVRRRCRLHRRRRARTKACARAGLEVLDPGLDDATFQTGKVTQKLPDGSIKQVDLLAKRSGTCDRERRSSCARDGGAGDRPAARDAPDRRAGQPDPESRIDPREENAGGVSQARLAIDVARAFIGAEIDERGERKRCSGSRESSRLSVDERALGVFVRYAIDPLLAVPLEDFRTTTRCTRNGGRRSWRPWEKSGTAIAGSNRGFAENAKRKDPLRERRRGELAHRDLAFEAGTDRGRGPEPGNRKPRTPSRARWPAPLAVTKRSGGRSLVVVASQEVRAERGTSMSGRSISLVVWRARRIGRERAGRRVAPHVRRRPWGWGWRSGEQSLRESRAYDAATTRCRSTRDERRRRGHGRGSPRRPSPGASASLGRRPRPKRNASRARSRFDRTARCEPRAQSSAAAPVGA